MEQPSQKQKNILATLAWFDVFGYPLTAVETVRYSKLFGEGILLEEVFDLLEAIPQVEHRNGYYFLTGNEKHVASRQQRYRVAKRKLQRARQAARFFGLLPSVRQVSLCNSLAIANAEEGSDIDFFLVCRPGTLWTTRLFLAGVLKLLGLRPTAKNQKDKFCLSFFVSENVSDLSRLELPDDDPYMRMWLATLRCLSFSTLQSDCHYPMVLRTGRFVEKIAKRIQMKKFPEQIRKMANLDSRVVISDDILKFHVNDRREFFRDEYYKRLAVLGLKT